MKKSRFVPLLLLVVLFVTLLTPCAMAAPPEMDVDAKAAILADAETGSILYSKNEEDKVYPASVTKIMTAMLTVESIEAGTLALTDQITVTDAAFADLAADGSTQNIKAGEIMTVQDLLYCVLVASANEACNILALAQADSLDAFVARMNDRAESLGCEDTNFVNTHGLHNNQHYTTASDLLKITMQAMKYPLFMEVCGTADYTVPATNLSESRHFYTTNSLLSQFRVMGYVYPYAEGIKTGHTEDAGYCLVSSAKKDDVHLISIVMGAEMIQENGVIKDHKSFSETRRLFNWGFANFTHQEILQKTEMVKEVAIVLGNADQVVIHPKTDLIALVPKDLDLSTLTWKINAPDQISAPIQAGEILGEITVVGEDGREYGTVPLSALMTVEKAGAASLVGAVETIVTGPGLIMLVFMIVMLIGVPIIVKVINRSRDDRFRK